MATCIAGTLKKTGLNSLSKNKKNNKKGTGDREKVENMNKDKIYEVEYMLGDEEKSGYVIADNESMASDVAYFLFGEGEDEPYKEIGIYDNSMYDFFVLAREDKYGNYQNMIFNTKEEALSKIGVDGWEKDDLKVYSDGLIMSLEEYEI